MRGSFDSRLRRLEAGHGNSYWSMSDAEIVGRVKQIDEQLRLAGVDLPAWPQGDLMASGYFERLWPCLRSAFPNAVK